MEPPTSPPAVNAAADVWDLVSSTGTGAAAVIAFAAATIAIWQSRIARRAQKATEEQAKIARETLEDERAERYEHAAPTFDVTVEPQSQIRPTSVRVRMRSGPPEVAVSIDWRARITWLDRAASSDPNGLVEADKSGIFTTTLVQNASVVVHHETRPGATLMHVLAKASISSTETRGARRTWQREQMADYAYGIA